MADPSAIYTPEKLQGAEKRLEERPYDLEAWGYIVRYAQNRKIEEARPLFEKLIQQFPLTGRYWKLFIELEMKSRNYERVEKLFQRCLMKILNLELWKCYLSYVKETKGMLPTYREKMAQAYDFALDKIGMDVMSYQIWSDYVKFLKGVDAVGSYAENQRITAVRKVFQRGCQNPMVNIEVFWKDYIAYEQGINPILAEKIISDRSRDYMNARRVAKEYESVTRGLNRNAPSVPPQGTTEEIKQVDLWKKYIAWEKSNPVRTEDHTVFTKRVMFAFEQCLLCLGHHPDVWYEAALFLEHSSKLLSEKGDVTASKMFSDEAATICERSTATVLKTNMLLYFAYADFEEGRMKYDKVHQIYNRFLDIKEIDPTLCYIQYMKFCRRAEGIKSARGVFKRAREDDRCQHQVYVAAALMEYYCSKDPIVTFKIFELGLKKYGKESGYVKAYIDYLSHLNEDNNTRVLFERVLTSGSLPDEDSIFIWNKFLEFESNIGDLPSVLKVEKRRAVIIEKIKEFEGKETALLVDRYKYLDLYPCSKEELKSLGYIDVQSQGTTQRSVSGLILPATAKKELASPATTQSRPDTLHMIPFKPLQDAPVGLHPVQGGVFPLPPAASHLVSILPNRTSFHGPFVDVEKLLDLFMSKLELPNEVIKENGVLNESASQYFETATAASNIFAENSLTRKHRSTTDGGKDSSDEDDGSAPPVKDVYRARQQKRVKT